MRPLFALVALLTVLPAQAQSLFWDGAGVGTTGAQGGTGTWDTNTTANWFDGSTNVVWPNAGTNNDAVFGGTAGTVTIASVSANDLTFSTTGYSLQGASTLTLNGTTNIITTGTGVSATIGNNTATVLAGTAGFIKAGSGTLILNPTTAATYTGPTTISGGQLTLDFSNLGSNAANLLPSGGNLTFDGTKTTDAKVVLQNAVGGGATLQTFGAITNGRGASYVLANPAAGTTMTVTASSIALGGTRGWNSTNGTVIIGVMQASQESQFTFNLRIL